MAQQTQSNVPTVSGDARVSSANCGQQPPSWDRDNNNNNSVQQAVVKRQRDLAETPDPNAEVIAPSPKTLLATNCFVCEICNKGFKRDQNLQMHRRGHNLPWKLRSKETTEYRCDCGTLFNRRDSFITHRDLCDSLAQLTINAQQGDPTEPEKMGERREGSPPPLKSPLRPVLHFFHGSVIHASSLPSPELQSPIDNADNATGRSNEEQARMKKNEETQGGMI